MGRLPAPPPAPRGDEAETLHGERIADPYRWLERDGAETGAWTEAQNARTRTALDAVPERARFAARLRELLGVGLSASRARWGTASSTNVARRASAKVSCMSASAAASAPWSIRTRS